MKKISLAIPTVFLIMLVLIQPCKVSAQEESSQNYYDIQLEKLCDTQEAKELNSYKNELLNYLNIEIKKENKAVGDDIYPLLDENDLDFTDETKIHGLKYHSSYTEYQYNTDLYSFTNSLTEDSYWHIIFQKGNSIYSAWLFHTNKKDTVGYNFAENWYINQFFVDKGQNRFSYLKDDTDVIKSNLIKLLGEKQEQGKDIQVIFTDMNYINTNCAVIFVNGKAKYMYYYTFSIPCDLMNENTPKGIAESIQKQSESIFKNFKEQGSTDVITLYSYNMIMFLINTCERYM